MLHPSYGDDVESQIWKPGDEIPVELSDEDADDLEAEIRGFFERGE